MRQVFTRPVSVLVGLGFCRHIRDAQEAVSFLEDFPIPLRDEAYEAALSVCRAALAGKAPMREAYDVFSAFARRRGILTEEPPVQVVDPAVAEGVRHAA